MITKNGGLEETWRFLDNSDDEVCDGWRDGEEEDGTDEEYGTWDSAHVAVVQWKADRDVSLHSHTSQGERGGARGDNCCHDLREAKCSGGVRSVGYLFYAFFLFCVIEWFQ